MRNLLNILFTTIILLGCSRKNEVNYPKENSAVTTLPKPQADSALKTEPETIKIEHKSSKIFKAILDFPKLTDTVSFIKQLKDYYKMDNADCYKINIKNYKKVKFYGSEKKYVLIETDCDFNNVKYQLALFTENGNFIQSISGYRYELIKVFPNENPMLLNLDVTNQGNGAHEFYKIENNSLVKLNKIYDDFPNTFDQHHDNAIFEPYEMKISFNDDNKDGFNDIVFKGQIILIQAKTKNGDWVDGIITNGKNVNYSIENPFKKAPIKFVLLYDKKTKTFKPKEDYKKKYRKYYY